MAVLCKASKLRDMHDDDVEFVADKYFDGNTPKSIKEALDEKANKDGISPALVMINSATKSKDISDVIDAGNVPYYLHTFGVGIGGVNVNLYYAGLSGGPDGVLYKFVGYFDAGFFSIAFDSKTNSFSNIAITTFVKPDGTVANAEHVSWNGIVDVPYEFNPSSHSHGAITNGGLIGRSTSPLNTTTSAQDILVLYRQSTDNQGLYRISSAKLDGITTNKFLSPKGTFESESEFSTKARGYTTGGDIDKALKEKAPLLPSRQLSTKWFSGNYEIALNSKSVHELLHNFFSDPYFDIKNENYTSAIITYDIVGFTENSSSTSEIATFEIVRRTDTSSSSGYTPFWAESASRIIIPPGTHYFNTHLSFSFYRDHIINEAITPGESAIGVNYGIPLAVTSNINKTGLKLHISVAWASMAKYK